MTLRKQLAALLAAGALGMAAMGTALAAGNNEHCNDIVNPVIAAGVGECEEESEEPTFEESEEPTFEQSEEPTFERSEEPVTEAPSFEQSEEPVTEAPSFDQSEEPVTEPPDSEPPVTEPPDTEPPPPSFFQSEEGVTDAPSEPDTTTIGGSDATGSPADGAWLLMVALGMLLASIVVLTPARVKNRR